MAKIGATGGNTDGTMGSFTAPRVGGFSGNKKQPTTDRFQNNFFSSLRREDQIKGQEQGPANKIVKFGAGVKPKESANGSLIKSISTNINNQFTDAISQLQNNVINIVSPVLDKLQTEHRRKLDDAETQKPSKLLGGFLDLLRNGLDFIKFLSDRKRLRALRQGIGSLKGAFADLLGVGESVAGALKGLLKKIAGIRGGKGGGGGLIGGIVGAIMGAIGTALAAKLLGGKKPPKPPRVPKTTPPKVRPRKPRIKGKFGVLAGIGGLLAGGMALAPAVKGTPSEEEVPEEISDQPLSKVLLDKFDKVLEQFSNAIDSLTKPAKTSPSTSTPPTGSGSGSETDSSTTGGGGAMPSEDQDLYTTATLASMEAGTDQARADVAQAVYNRMGQRGQSATEVATAKGQFAVMFDQNDNIDPDAKNIKTLEDAVKFRMKKKGETAEVAEQQIRSTIAAMRNPQLIKNAQTFVQDRTSFRASAKNYQTLTNSIWRGGAGDNQFLNEEVSGKGTVAVPEFVTGVEVGSDKVKVEPAPQQSQVMQKVSQQVAQPANKGGGVSVVPMGGTPQQQARAGSPRGKTASPSSDAIPFLDSSTSDNAHNMFSRMTYNVVG